MGIHLCLVDEAFKDHPGWDCGRYSGDRDFGRWLRDVPKVEKPMRAADDFDGRWRPTDFDAARAAIPADAPNLDRFHNLLDLLEANPGLWVYESW